MSEPVVCTRCGQQRWPAVVSEPFVCYRCRKVLDGYRNVDDPLPSDAQRAARAVGAVRLRALRAAR